MQNMLTPVVTSSRSLLLMLRMFSLTSTKLFVIRCWYFNLTLGSVTNFLKLKENNNANQLRQGATRVMDKNEATILAANTEIFWPVGGIIKNESILLFDKGAICILIWVWGGSRLREFAQTPEQIWRCKGKCNLTYITVASSTRISQPWAAHDMVCKGEKYINKKQVFRY